MRDIDVKMNWPILATLFRVVGKRVFQTFCLVSFLVVFLLAAVNVTSRHAMQLYVDDQVTPGSLGYFGLSNGRCAAGGRGPR